MARLPNINYSTFDFLKSVAIRNDWGVPHEIIDKISLINPKNFEPEYMCFIHAVRINKYLDVIGQNKYTEDAANNLILDVIKSDYKTFKDILPETRIIIKSLNPSKDIDFILKNN